MCLIKLREMRQMKRRDEKDKILFGKRNDKETTWETQV